MDQPTTQRLPTYADVEEAAGRLDGVAHRTPVMTSRTANARTGAELFFKMENLQRTGAFKFRGAYNSIAALDADARARGVVAFSSGNHAQAIAHAGALLGAPTVIVMPTDAPTIKVTATREYGAEVVLYDRFTEDREAIGRRLAAERGLALIPPFDHPDVIAGQGTATKELIEEVGHLDRIYVCLGGGGLTSGACLAAGALAPGCAVYGVEPEAGDDVRRSLEAGRIVQIPVPKTIADGAQTTAPGALTFPLLQANVAGVVTVSDAALVETMRFFAERMKQVVEPTGCLAAAAAFAADDLAGKRVGIVVSGGNVDLARFAALIAG
ncbi:threo-3-hydroxy-L-aspartate ammonia-lyase [Salinarimonas ramus]|uniref:Serine/threonine dehydratase n=1 Tax=Salinarimonas ramus TaxID=690164 RepID=A0A917Q3Z3_9HYPH|nr:threo-3-hydroxy-L-aspartate ammonia-lyase [Salinarimonas ramus]GGK19876.1 serine/threonine dehydratase [Salinarimonas ramus]